MGYMFVDKNGVALGQPINCPATDLQVKTQLEDILGGVPMPNGDIGFTYDLSEGDQARLESTLAKIKEKMVDPGCVLIPFITDLHAECDGASIVGTNISRMKAHLYMYNEIAREVEPSLCVYGGDYLQNSSATNRAAALTALNTVKTWIKKTTSVAPRFVLKGNHDDNTMYTDYHNGWVDDIMRWGALQNIDAAKVVRGETNEKYYGYYDIPNKKIRCIFLNTVDVPTAYTESGMEFKGQWETGISYEQMEFIKNALTITDSNWDVILFSHHTIATGIGTETGTGITSGHGGSALINILDAFSTNGEGSETWTDGNASKTISYDFSDNGSNNRIVACVTGHVHKNIHDTIGDEDINHVTLPAIDGHQGMSPALKAASNYIVINKRAGKVSFIINGEGYEDFTLNY